MKKQTKKQSSKNVEQKNVKKATPATIAAAPKVEPKAKPEKAAKRTIKTVVIEALATNSETTNASMIAAVKAEFPTSAFDEKHAAWYRSQARKGLLTGTPIAILRQKFSKNTAAK